MGIGGLDKRRARPPGSRPEPVPFLAVHRIGRTGRSGNTGIATTFINKACGEALHIAAWLYLGF
jgi:hypothetical protein